MPPALFHTKNWLEAFSNSPELSNFNKVEFLKEKIDTEKIDTLFKKYINDTKGLVNELIQIGGIDSNGNTLVNNEEIGEKVTQINQKINEYVNTLIRERLLQKTKSKIHLKTKSRM